MSWPLKVPSWFASSCPLVWRQKGVQGGGFSRCSLVTQGVTRKDLTSGLFPQPHPLHSVLDLSAEFLTSVQLPTGYLHVGV